MDSPRTPADPPVANRPPRHEVPWTGGDVLFLLFLYAALQLIVPTAVVASCRSLGWLPAAAEKTAATAAPLQADADLRHPIKRLLYDASGPAIILLCVAVAVIAAPVVEEFLFRLVVQGWLEKMDRATGGLFAVVAVALGFCAIHFRGTEPTPDPNVLACAMLGGLVANLLTFAAGLLWLRKMAHATAQDLGWSAATWRRDLALGFGGFFAAVIVITASEKFVQSLLPPEIAPDPILLIPFALVVGILYWRTHRLLPSITAHVCLNSLAVISSWFE